MTIKKYKAYLFDFDYTLADSSKGIVKCYRNVLNNHSHYGISDMDIKRTIGKTLEESFSIMTGITDKEILSQYRKEYVKEADRIMTANTVLYEETLDVLNKLKEEGAFIGIISTKYRYRIMELLSTKLPHDFLDIVVGGEDVKNAKPSPEGLEFAITKLNLNKDDVMYVGDSTVDAETAMAAGVDFTGILHGMTTREELEKYPHKNISNDLNILLEK